MNNTQSLTNNCCHFIFHSLSNNTSKPLTHQHKNIPILRKHKTSLKNYSSLKHLNLQPLTKIPTQIPSNQPKSIIEQLNFYQDDLKNQLNALKEQNPFSHFNIYSQPQIRSHINVKHQPSTLQKSKSLAKVRFSYTSIQTDTSEHNSHQYATQVKLEKPFKSQVSTKKSSLKVSEIVKREEEETKRAIELQVPSLTIRRPKSIISIDDQEEMQDEMKQSLIIGRHEGMGSFSRLL